MVQFVEYQLKYYVSGSLRTANCDLYDVKISIVKEGLNRKRIKGNAKINFNNFVLNLENDPDYITDYQLFISRIQQGYYQAPTVNSIEYLPEIWKNGSIYCKGYLFFNDNINPETKTISATFEPYDIYNEFVTKYDKEVNWCNVTPEKTSHNILSKDFLRLEPILGSPGRRFTPPDYSPTAKYIDRTNETDMIFETLTNFDTEKYVLYGGHVWSAVYKEDYFSGIEPSLANSAYWYPYPTIATIYYFSDEMSVNLWQCLPYQPDNTWVERILTKPFGSIVYVKDVTQQTISIPYTYRKLTKILNYLMQETDSNYFFEAANFNVNVPITNQFFALMDKADAKRPTASTLTSNNSISLKNLLDILWKTFKIDWFLSESGENVQLNLISTKKYVESLSSGTFDLSSYCKGLYNFTVNPEKPKKELFTFESSDNLFQQGEINYTNVGDIIETNEIQTVNNNLDYLFTNPKNASDTGLTFVICNSNGEIASGGVTLNYYCSIEALRDYYWRYYAYYKYDVDGNVFANVRPDKIHAEIKIPNINIFSVDFTKFAKTLLSDTCEIMEITEDFKTQNVTIKVRFYDFNV